MTVPAEAPVAPAPVVPAPPYHRLTLLWPNAAWWRPLVGLLIGLGLYIGSMVIVLVVSMAFILPGVFEKVDAGVDPELAMPDLLDLTDPWVFLLTVATIIPMLPAALIGFRIAGGKPMGLLISVVGRMRWRWLLFCAGPAAIVLLVSLVVAYGVDVAMGGPAAVEPVAPVASPWLFVLIVLLVPFQAAAEEFAFRGVLMQTIGAWLKNPAWAILIPVPLFVLGHLYDIWGQIAVGVFAIAAGWITWRTGGLEAAIALHVVNNLVAFLLGAVGLSDPSAASQSVGSTAVGIALPIAFVLWIDAVHRRRAREWRLPVR